MRHIESLSGIFSSEEAIDLLVHEGNQNLHLGNSSAFL